MSTNDNNNFAQRRLTFRPSIDDPEQLAAYLRFVTDQYLTLRASILLGRSPGQGQGQDQDDYVAHGTLPLSAGSAPTHQPPLNSSLLPASSSGGFVPGTQQLPVSGAQQQSSTHTHTLQASSSSAHRRQTITKSKQPNIPPVSLKKPPPKSTNKTTISPSRGSKAKKKKGQRNIKSSRKRTKTKADGNDNDDDDDDDDVLDADTRARIQRVTANQIDYTAPDPEQDAPPGGETEDDRRKRLERIKGRRKRAKKFIEIDQYHHQITELSKSNRALRTDNIAFRERIDLLKDMLKQGITPSQDLLCLPTKEASRETVEANKASESSIDHGDVSEAQYPTNTSTSTSVAALAPGQQFQHQHRYRREHQSQSTVMPQLNTATEATATTATTSTTASSDAQYSNHQNANAQFTAFLQSNNSMAALLPPHLWQHHHLQHQQQHSYSSGHHQGGFSAPSINDTGFLLLQQSLLQSLHGQANATNLLQHNPTIAEALVHGQAANNSLTSIGLGSTNANTNNSDAAASNLYAWMMQRQQQQQQQQGLMMNDNDGEIQRHQSGPHTSQGFPPPPRGDGGDDNNNS